MAFPIGLAIAGVSSILGGLGGQAEADAQNRAQEAQYEQNMQSWRYGKKRTRADYQQNRKQWRLNKRNEETLAAWKDDTNLQDWQYNLKIQATEYAQKQKEFAKSEQIYGQQLTFNQMAQAAANEAEYRKLEDSMKELAFQNQDLVIKALQTSDVTAVKGQQGRTAAKGEQNEFFSLGNNQAILAESLLSAKADAGAAIRKIAADKFGADLAAEAARMLKPERLPQPPKPLKTPIAQFLKPRKPKEFDFGPRPTKGVMASSAGAWMGAGASFLESQGGTIAKGLSTGNWGA